MKIKNRLKKIFGIENTTRVELIADIARREYFTAPEAALAIDAILANTPAPDGCTGAILTALKRKKHFDATEAFKIMSELAVRTPEAHLVFYSHPARFIKEKFGCHREGLGSTS